MSKNLEYLEKAKNAGSHYIEGEDWGYRKARALEIIAEELCNLNKQLGTVINHNVGNNAGIEVSIVRGK